MTNQLEMFQSGATPFTVKTVHANSVESYYTNPAELGKRAAEVQAWFRRQVEPASDRECMAGLGYTDMNSVRPRITELIQVGILREVGNRTDPITGKRVRLVEVAR